MLDRGVWFSAVFTQYTSHGLLSGPTPYLILNFWTQSVAMGLKVSQDPQVVPGSSFPQLLEKPVHPALFRKVLVAII